MANSALVLAPFSRGSLQALSLSIPVKYESWMDTRRLYAPEELAERINSEGISVLVVEADFVFDEVFVNSKPLRFLGVCRNSLDHIDVVEATKHGVSVVNTPGRNAQAVAELTIGLMLSLARGIPSHNRYVTEGKWQNPVEPYTSMRGVELRGKTLGLIGFGSIGRNVARLGRAFGMEVMAYDPYVGVPGSRKAGTRLETMDKVLRQADFLSIHTSNDASTKHLLDEEKLSLMKAGCYIINTAAYSIIEESALVENLKSGHLAGAAMDVHQTQPIPPSSPLLDLENVILTPHIGGATDGTVDRQSWMMVEEIRRFLNGQRPRRLVNREVWRRRG